MTSLGASKAHRTAFESTLTAKLSNRKTKELLATAQLSRDDPGTLVGGNRFATPKGDYPLWNLSVQCGTTPATCRG